MPLHSRAAIYARVVLLPLALAVGTVAGLGSYYEASDDTTLAWLFAGVLSVGPITAVPLYFHGYGHALAALYGAVPGVPWLGVLLAAMLAAATMLVFAVLDRLLRPHLRPRPLALALVGFFAVAWLEHWMWFSYVRVALLLAGAAVLFAAQRPARRGALAVGLVGLGAAWLLRPSLAMVGFGAALPAALWLAGGWRRAAPVLLGGGLLLALGTGGAAALRTPAQARTQALDGQLARVVDFDQLRPQPRTAADSLGTVAVDLWLLGDSTVVSDALFRRAYAFAPADFFGRVLPAKLGQRLGLLGRDYFPVLLALAAGAGLLRRRARPGFWWVQAGFAGALLLLAGLLKLPARLALPLLDFWLITTLAYALRPKQYEAGAAEGAGKKPLPAAKQPVHRWLLAGALVAGLLYGAKTWHRRQVLGPERSRHEATLAAIERLGAGRVRILAGTNDLLKSLSPFRSYAPGPGPVLLLTGWNAHDASQARLRRALSGHADQTGCLRYLAASGGAGKPPLWVLTPETAAWLGRRFALGGPRLRLVPVPGPPFLADTTLREYRPEAGRPAAASNGRALINPMP